MSSKERLCGVVLPSGPSTHEGLRAEMARFPLWYNGYLPVPSIPKELLPFTEGTHYLSTKQVPSSTVLRFAGSQSVTANRDNLFRAGFTLEERSLEDLSAKRDLTVRRIQGDTPAPSGSLASLLIEAADLADSVHLGEPEYDIDEDHSGSEVEDVPSVLEEREGTQIRLRKSSLYRIKYEDPWKIHAGRILGIAHGKQPRTILWSGDGIRLQDPLPPRVLGPRWNAGTKNSVRFSSISDIDVKIHVIYEHTHWGKALRKLCNEPKSEYQAWARTLRYRINRFLRGGSDPTLSQHQLSALFEEHRSNLKARSDRLIEMLKTVDGIFVQRYLAYPEEVWTWQRFDMFTLGNISYLIGDEFLDGVMRPEALTVDTAYSQLKRARKWFKETSHRGVLNIGTVAETDVSPFCRQFMNVWKRALTAQGGRRTYLIGVLSQTRGCGTPPPLVLLQSKVKFIRTVGMESPPTSRTSAALQEAALGEVLDALPQESFTGLATKARVSATTASCWEHTRREGGTTEAAREILASVPYGEDIPIRDLDTGQIQSYRSRDRFGSVGEVLFWISLDHVLRTPEEDLKNAFLTVVKEPGKARSVTKARACLKIVLDLVNKLCSEPLAKGIRSSQSGMTKANHGWNLFNRLMSDELKDMVFCLESREENAYEGYVERTDTFKNLFMSSTDYEEATDQLRLDVASRLGQAWMRKCGIPRLLRAIVEKTCYRPRSVFFRAEGALKTVGLPTQFPEIRMVRMVRGVLMGDPLTKVVLHLTNVVTRHIGERMYCPDFYARFPNGRQAFESFTRATTVK